jgi:RNA polymerase sigma factor (sigma-70 family)
MNEMEKFFYILTRRKTPVPEETMQWTEELESLMKAAQKRHLSLFYALVRMGWEKEDVEQELRITVWKGVQKYDPQRAQLSTMVYWLVRNRLINLIAFCNRKKRKQENTTSLQNLLECEQPARKPDYTIYAEEMMECIRKELQNYPPEDVEEYLQALAEDREAQIPYNTFRALRRKAQIAIQKYLETIPPRSHRKKPEEKHSHAARG